MGEPALRIFLIVSGDYGGKRVEFFWPPVKKTKANSTPKNKEKQQEKKESNDEQKISGIFPLEIDRQHSSSSASSSSSSPTDSQPQTPSLVPLSKSKSTPNLKTNATNSNHVSTEEWSFQKLQKDLCIYGISLDDIGCLLYPSHRYHHKIFEVKVNDILFISYPFCWAKKTASNKEIEWF